jgi:hypothetical protein
MSLVIGSKVTERVKLWSRAKGSNGPWVPMRIATATMKDAEVELVRASLTVRSALEFQVHVTAIYPVTDTEKLP